ncbi:hypothetical protein Q5741_18765 [Paenibacillus sp. JX-17]|uniref:Uncharacterized protein n=1 Tax=Paenibacillus lacisoli TaxID=3064525 RepID=A0ABT9CGR0_9BACL|nr:hypothetical protein [Paenibacillus sp. JX-17]MDO7908447.1 hypothetical protein [Paenibacillus sp. JX-17]
MRYFEIIEPYYAMIKAETEEQAIEKYVEFVADDDGSLKDEIAELERDYALVLYSRCPAEDMRSMKTIDLLNEFQDEEPSVLIVDGSLL